MGASRPICEECGYIELDEFGRFIWNLLGQYSEALVTVNGFGAYTINVAALNFLAEAYGLEDKLLMLRGIQIIVKEAMKQELGNTDVNRS
ncbi:MAG: hypothetical protein JRI34_13140 [Deltaproteobacteria bacterium]|nr:hypothetical protein [Deltaproteobacteria bacterium]